MNTIEIIRWLQGYLHNLNIPQESKNVILGKLEDIMNNVNYKSISECPSGGFHEYSTYWLSNETLPPSCIKCGTTKPY